MPVDCVRRWGAIDRVDGGVLGERGRESIAICGGVPEPEWLLRALGRATDLDRPRVRSRTSSEERMGPNEELARGLWGALAGVIIIGPLLPPRPSRLGLRSLRNCENAPALAINGPGPAMPIPIGSSMNIRGDEGEGGAERGEWESAKSARDEGSIVRGEAKDEDELFEVEAEARPELGTSTMSRSNCLRYGGVLARLGAVEFS